MPEEEIRKIVTNLVEALPNMPLDVIEKLAEKIIRMKIDPEYLKAWR